MKSILRFLAAFLAATVLSASAFAGTINVTGSTVCTVTGANVACGPLTVSPAATIELQRITHPQVWNPSLGLYTQAYTDVTVTIAGQDYVTNPNTGYDTQGLQGTQTWQGIAYAAGLAPVSYTLQVRASLTTVNKLRHWHYTVLSGNFIQ